MGAKYKMERKLLMQIQLAIIGVVLLLFLFGFFVEPYYFPYVLVPLLLINIVFLFVNKTKGLFVNLLMLGCSFLLFLILVDIIASLLGLLLAIFHLSRIGYVYNQQYVKAECCNKEETIESKPKTKKKKLVAKK
jgi:hypothetical protein